LEILELDIEQILTVRENCLAIMAPQNKLYNQGFTVIVKDKGSYTIPGEKGVYWKNLPDGTVTQAMHPKSYVVATVYKEKIDKLESHLAYMLFNKNAEYVKSVFKNKYPNSDYFQLVVLKRE
jgi:hypothetical protein